LTSSDFRFSMRVWFLKDTKTVCTGCARGCNMEIQHEAGSIYRCVPRTNMEVNQYWLCDEGRFNYHYVHDSARVVTPAISEGGSLALGDWGKAIDKARATLKGKKVTVLVGSDLTQEEAKLLQDFVPKNLGNATMLHFGTPGIRAAADDAPADTLLKRKSKTSNLHGLEKLGLKPFESMPSGTEAVVIFRGGRATLPDTKGLPTVAVGVFEKPKSESYAAILPGASFAEKDGTVVNYEGREQRVRRSIVPPGQSKALSEILMMWMNRGSAATGVA
jgi:NADH-quinone oxidoreductase subunit G